MKPEKKASVERFLPNGLLSRSAIDFRRGANQR
jgi:hypothetical protein